MARIKTHSRKLIVLAITAVLTIAGAGVAFAYWTSSGTGAGTATTASSTAFTVTAADAVGTIQPGGAGQTVAFTVKNASGGVQRFNTATVTMADSAGVAWVPTEGCLIGDYTATITTAPTAGNLIAGGTVTGTVTVTLANTGLNQDACQGQTVPLYFTAS